jgi:MFS family permease
MRRIGRNYWKLVIVAFVLTLARFSEAFLVLKAQDVGLPMALTPLVLAVMSVIYAMAAYPVGALSDRMDRKALLMIGVFFLIAADLVLGVAHSPGMLAFGVALWGLHMAFSQGLLSAMVADTAPVRFRGTAFGVFNFACGIALLLSSVIAGALWDMYGPAATFFAGAAFTALAMAGLVFTGYARRKIS